MAPTAPAPAVSDPAVPATEPPPAPAVDPALSERLERIFGAQRARRPHLAESTARERIDTLRRIAEWVEANREEIRRAGHEDFRTPATEVDVTEV